MPVTGRAKQRSQMIERMAGRLRANWRGYVRQWWVFLVLTALAALADMGTTIHFMRTAGAEAEGHPAVRVVSLAFGPVLGPILGKLCQLAVVILLTVYLRRYALYIFVAVIILYAWAAWYNLWGCELRALLSKTAQMVGASARLRNLNVDAWQRQAQLGDGSWELV